MIKVLANDGLEKAGIEKLSAAGIRVDTTRIPQERLRDSLNKYDAVVVRSATRITSREIDASPNLKLIVRAGSGTDNIDVDYARSKKIEVTTTPGVSSQSVAELVFAHLFTLSRFLHDSNRRMPKEGAERFSELKKRYSKGTELKGKTLGIIGFGSIGQTVAKIALGLGMHVMPFKLHHAEVKIQLDFFTVGNVAPVITLKTVVFDDLLAQSDFITLHVPFRQGDPPILYKERINRMKDGVMLVNTSRGGVIAESDLLEALNSGKVAAAALDVFEGEPKPRKEILEHPRISLTPHIGASTLEAQARVGVEAANKIIQFFSSTR
ncbi:MAG TPA: D-2-hydroxyacid dehydrogenase [Chitinophagales bacterium]|nr:D-2-hydroxyacid dehydrogenase [Chitinophagales bacterium]